MTASFTPGPWIVNTAGSAKAGQPFKVDEFFVYAPNAKDDTAICADVIDPVTTEPSEANARLIAAAPELLDALEVLLPMFAEWHSEFPQHVGDKEAPVLELARAAIAKATGAPA